jgi:hypothetical protein
MKNANHFFGNSNGSENLFRYSFTHFVYTDGVKTLARDSQAFWLIDLIISHQTYFHVKKEKLQVWDLINSQSFAPRAMIIVLHRRKFHSMIFLTIAPRCGW